MTRLRESEVEGTAPTPEKPQEPLGEAVALRDLHEQVRTAFEAKFSPPPGMGMGGEYYPVDVYEGFVTCRKKGKIFRAAYTLQDGEVAFTSDQLEEVEAEFKPVKAAGPPAPARTAEAQPPPAAEPAPLTVTESFHEAEVAGGKLLEAQDDPGWIWEVTVIRAGRTKERSLPNGGKYVRDYPIAVLEAAISLFEGLGVCAFGGQEHAPSPGAKGVKDEVGFLENVRRAGEEIRAHLHLFKDADWLRQRLLGLRESKRLGKTGLSIDAGGAGTWSKDGDLAVMTVTEITEASSVEVVRSPAAGGQVQRLVASTQGDGDMNIQEILALIESTRPKLLEGVNRETVTMEQATALLKEAMAPAPAAAPAPKAEPKADTTLQETINGVQNQIRIMECGRVLDTTLAESTLPKQVQAKIRKRFAETVFKVEDLNESIAEELAILQALFADGMPRSYGADVKVTAEEHDKKVRALEAMFWGGPQDATHPNFPAELKGVRPYTSLRRAYIDITGNKDASAREIFAESAMSAPPFDAAEEPRLFAKYTHFMESLATSSWTQVFADTLRRRMTAEYALPALQDWRKIASDISSVPDFRTNYRLQIGGYGTLPTVSEQGTYQGLTSPGDQHESYAVAKRGGLDDLTFEMIKNDDVGAVRRIPVKLGRAAAQTLYRTVFDLIEDNDALISDSTALVHADHANAIGAALSNAALTTARQQMMDQAAYGDTAEILGIANLPKYLIVPNELNETGFQLTSTWGAGQGEHDTTSRNTNFHGSYGLQLLPVPYFAVATDYWVAADPMSMPTIEVGFLDGRQEPEIFVQDQPNVGSVFTADKITYKIRHIYGTAALDYRWIQGYIV